MIDYFHHVTVTTGHSTESYQVDIDPDAIEVGRVLLGRALAGEPALVELGNGESVGIAAGQAGRSLHLQIFSRTRGAINEVLVATCAVSPGDPDGAGLWRNLHEGATLPIATNAMRPPEGAWCAVRLEPAGTVLVGAVRWLGDFERGLAWAWFNMLGQAPEAPPANH